MFDELRLQDRDPSGERSSLFYSPDQRTLKIEEIPVETPFFGKKREEPGLIRGDRQCQR